jgi:crotonobetainyl-CoA:carnitine CoA-transferase CaiB-like acyl-CoA transferase
MFAPLEGIRVLDLTTSIAGPYCTWILASLGADVIKVERPDGDDTRTWGPPFWHGESATFLAFNSGKRSLSVDLTTPDGVEIVRTLAARTDVFVENLRPGRVKRFGLGFNQLAEQNTHLVYCSIGAFGRRGPLRDRPGYDPLMQAAGGLMSITGEPGRPPVRAGASIVDQGTGMWAALAVLAALRARDAGAGAQFIETSLYEAALSWVPYQLIGTLATQTPPGPLGSGIGIIVPYQAFAVRDGWLMIAAGNDRLFRSLCGVLGLSELADNSRFKTNANRVAHREELIELLASRLSQDDTELWLQQLVAAGVPAAPVQNLVEVLASEQTRALDILHPLEHPRIPELQIVAPPLSVNNERLALHSPPPDVGEHSADVLQEIGYSADKIQRLTQLRIVGH